MNCPLCGESTVGLKAKSFRDVSSFREFQESGMCQPCQDELSKEEDCRDAG
jgi:hypothetical protein